MSGSQEAGRSNPLAGRVSIHPSTEYQGVRFLFGNQTERPIGVSFSQPIPDGAAPDQFRFQQDRHGDSWTVSEADLSFAVEIDGGSTVETGYALTDTEVSAVWNAINQGTVTVSDADGEVLGQVDGLEPTVADDETTTDSSTDGSATGATVADEASVAGVDATAVAGLTSELDAATPAPEADEAETAAGGDEDAEAADLPARRADYILSDVRGEIESAAEFEWRTLRERSTPRRFVDRVRSWLGF